MQTPVFNCPSCNTPVEGKADYIARGLRCPACGVGFMPVHIETWKQIGPKAKSLPNAAWLYPLLALLKIGTGFISFWAAIAVAVVVLLALILRKLSVLTKRTS
jgi:hypothetical protein